MAPGVWNTGNGLQRDQRRNICPGPVSTHTQPDAQSRCALRHRAITAIIPDGLSQHQPKDRTCMESVQRMGFAQRSEEHTSELQSPCNLVCRLLLEKKKKKNNIKVLSNETAQSAY